MVDAFVAIRRFLFTSPSPHAGRRRRGGEKRRGSGSPLDAALFCWSRRRRHPHGRRGTIFFIRPFHTPRPHHRGRGGDEVDRRRDGVRGGAIMVFSRAVVVFGSRGGEAGGIHTRMMGPLGGPVRCEGNTFPFPFSFFFGTGSSFLPWGSHCRMAFGFGVACSSTICLLLRFSAYSRSRTRTTTRRRKGGYMGLWFQRMGLLVWKGRRWHRRHGTT